MAFEIYICKNGHIKCMSGCNPKYSGHAAPLAAPVSILKSYQPPQGQNMPSQRQDIASQKQYPPAQVQDLATDLPLYLRSKVSNGGSQTASVKHNTGLSNQYTQASSQQSRPRQVQFEGSRRQPAQSQASRPKPCQPAGSRRKEAIMSSQRRSVRESQPASRQHSSSQSYVPESGEPSSYPTSKKTNDRPSTNVAPLGDLGRSILEGLEEPTKMQRKSQYPQSAATSRQDSSSTSRICSSNHGKPSTWPDAIRPVESRLPTHIDLLGNNFRTILEGMVSKKEMSKVEKAQNAEEERKRQK